MHVEAARIFFDSRRKGLTVRSSTDCFIAALALERELPDDVVVQLVEGELHATPRPAIDHQRASSILGSDLVNPFDRGRGGPGGWWIVDEPELHLGRNVLVPDLAGWRRKRLPALPREPFDAVELTLTGLWIRPA